MLTRLVLLLSLAVNLFWFWSLVSLGNEYDLCLKLLDPTIKTVPL